MVGAKDDKNKECVAFLSDIKTIVFRINTIIVFNWKTMVFEVQTITFVGYLLGWLSKAMALLNKSLSCY